MTDRMESRENCLLGNGHSLLVGANCGQDDYYAQSQSHLSSTSAELTPNDSTVSVLSIMGSPVGKKSQEFDGSVS